MLRFLTFAALFGCLLAPWSHAGDPKKKAPEPVDYYPLQVGNSWVYDLDANGKKLTMDSKIARVEVIDGVPLAVLEAEINGQVAATEHLRTNDKGTFRHRMNQFVPDPPIMLLKSPLKADDKWSGEFQIGNVQAKYSAETKAEDVEVPAGKFKTIRVDLRVEEKDMVVTTAYWFAPNVGYVKQTIAIGPVTILAELRKYEVRVAK